MRTFAVSDLHGCWDALENALQRCAFKEGVDRLVIAGDLFDRGPDSYRIYRFVRETPHIYVVKGNHELILENALKRDTLSLIDIRNGVGETIRSFAEGNGRGIGFSLQEYLSKKFHIELQIWLANLPYSYIDTHFFIAHSYHPMLNNYQSMTVEDWKKVTWTNPLSYISTNSVQSESGVNGKKMLFGHWWASLFYEDMYQIEGPMDRVWCSKGFVALDTCVNRSKYLGLVELKKNGEIKVWE